MASDNCPFCKLIANNEVPVYKKDTGVYYFEPLNPVTKGHRLFVPLEHYSNAGYHPAVTGLVVGQAVEYANKLYSDYNLIINNGKAASQTVGHLHVHIVPRVEGDGLILPWTNQDRDWTQTIYETMEDVPVDHLVTVDAARENSEHIAKQLKTMGVV